MMWSYTSQNVFQTVILFEERPIMLDRLFLLCNLQKKSKELHYEICYILYVEKFM